MNENIIVRVLFWGRASKINAQCDGTYLLD